jgi:cobalt-precorrin 5A hydrolase/precorrin-3B C17-methyltransferase
MPEKMPEKTYLEEFCPIVAIATTPQAVQTLQRTGIDAIWLPEAIAPQFPQFQAYSGALRDRLAEIWSVHRSLVFCLATGAVVRLIAPLLQDKATDPAVVVIDEAGKFVISLCGGHQAGADRLAQTIACQLGATPILTGAANRANRLGIDMIGAPFGWRRGEGDWTGVSAAISQQLPVQVIQEAGSTLWQAQLPPEHPFEFTEESTAKARVWITPMQRRFAPHSQKVQWHPRVLWLGIGCERGTPKAVIAQAVQDGLQRSHLAVGAIAGVATIDLKADEVGLLEFCAEWDLPLRCFPAATLRSVPVPNPSDRVAAEVGTPSVAEAAALTAAGSETAWLRVPKQIMRLEGQPGAVTLAIAQAEQEFTGRMGKLWLVGTGPGCLDQITPAAQSAIVQADAIVGYSLYVELIRPLLRPGQIVEALPITQERQRAERAIELATWGLTVAVVSSGDCGIYGMAGLVLEALQMQGWDGITPQVQVFPGITALQAAASRVGAPLMHDFCAISLSDLLTPWNVIEQRLHAAATADFVVALYNPKSKTRTEQIAIAQAIFLQHRNPATPVALVQSAYRADERVTLTTLERLLDESIDMLTTVLIGNQSSRMHANWIITPRGYLGFDREIFAFPE